MNPDISLNEKSYSMFSAYSVFKKICTDREGHSSSSANSWLVYSAYFHIFVGFFFQIKFMKTAKGGGFVSPPPSQQIAFVKSKGSFSEQRVSAVVLCSVLFAFSYHWTSSKKHLVMFVRDSQIFIPEKFYLSLCTGGRSCSRDAVYAFTGRQVYLWCCVHRLIIHLVSSMGICAFKS